MANTMTYSHDWWYRTEDSDEEVRIRLTINEDRVCRVAGAAMRNDSGKAQSGPFLAEITERRPRKPE